MAGKGSRAGKIVLIVLGLLIVCGWVLLRLAAFEPMEDMRQRADALPLPADFVLVSESYRGMGIDGSPAVLERVYHAAWPGACDSLRRLQDRAGPPLGIAAVPRAYADSMCNHGAWYPAGWRAWFGNIRNYDLRLYGRAPGFGTAFLSYPQGLYVLYPRMDSLPPRPIVIPAGRARIDIEIIGHRGR